VSATEESLRNNEAYAKSFGKGDLPLPPAKKLAVVACMDARLHVSKILGLNEGDAHVIRNAGGAVTDDAIRSLAISQRLLGTSEVLLIHHTDCGMLTFSDDAVKAQIEKDTGIRPPFALEAFSNLEDDVRQSIARIKASPFIPKKDAVRGFIYDVTTGRLNEVQERVPASVTA
jgi:carbonic anhydrase